MPGDAIKVFLNSFHRLRIEREQVLATPAHAAHDSCAPQHSKMLGDRLPGQPGAGGQPVEISLIETEREQLERWSRGHQTPRSLAERAQIVLLAAPGMGNDAIRDRLRCRLARVSKERRRFARARCAGLSGARRPGQPVKYGADSEKRLRARQALRGASFTRVRQLREAMDAFIAAYNPQALPFEWTKRDVRSVEPKYKYAYLRN